MDSSKLQQTREREDGQENGGSKEEERPAEAGEEERGVLRAVGDIVSQSALSLKEAVLGGSESQSSNVDAANGAVKEGSHSHSHSQIQSKPTLTGFSSDPMDEAAEVSILVHSMAHD